MDILFSWDTKNSFKRIADMSEIHELYIASAFISEAGVKWLKEVTYKNKIPKERVFIFLSEDFSMKKPSELLNLLISFSKTYIVTQKKLHAKTILAVKKNNIGTLLMGSANLTYNGMNENLELTNVREVKLDEDALPKYFFDHLKSSSKSVDEGLIKEYKLREAALLEAQEHSEMVRKILKGIFQADDPVIPSEENIKEYYFDYEDYVTLFPRNGPLLTSKIMRAREKIQRKLLDLHSIIGPFCNQRGLHEHWNTNHVTSLIRPTVFNYSSVTWMAIRYGKSLAQIEKLNPDYNAATDQLYSFPKHGCLQMSLSADGFSISLFHSVKNDAWDRAFVRDRLFKDPTFMQQIVDELKQLKGLGYEWHLYDPLHGEGDSFSIDDNDLDEFPEFYKQDDDGYESYLITRYKPDDPRIRTQEDIITQLRTHFQKLKFLYNMMVQM